MGLYIHTPSGVIESFTHWWDLFSKANLWQWNLSCLRVRPWDHCPHKNGFMVHISAKGTRKVNQGREISRGYAFLQTISAYSWSSNFPESIACQNQFKSSLKHSVLTTGYQGPPSHMESSQFSQSLRPDKEEREHVWTHATACLCFSHGIQIYHGHTYAHHCPTQAFLNVLRVLLKILVFLSSLTDLLIKMINMIVL